MEPTRFVSNQDRLTLTSLRKMLLRYCAKQLQTVVYDCRAQGVDVACYPKNRMVALLLSLVSSAALSGEDFDVLVSLGVPAIVLALRKQLAVRTSTLARSSMVQVILDEGVSRRKGGISSNNDSLAAQSGPEAAAMMKIGARVVRGPDWKWGDQVGFWLFCISFLTS